MYDSDTFPVSGYECIVQRRQQSTDHKMQIITSVRYTAEIHTESANFIKVEKLAAWTIS